jgi:hypothetical protein
MDNIETYKRAKFQLKISYNIDCAKITKSDVCSSEQCKLSNIKICEILSFLWSLEYKEFGIETLDTCRSQHCPYLKLISDLLEISN